ncbi:coproporphyrinogen III oxidase [Sphingopyxis fribergensis]|uniref:Coproporphyrinogen III oxidase n=1 Tax=Sphingopyxis fribergensis TaxID=1515612 RepID=A0A0A7PMZ0_9SPHN|nr:radical SAM protein [Sphingopyxis fribergensis]AJA11369.1 coproporphyrinogen III oxidase [Sphingopyxis fribergensis]
MRLLDLLLTLFDAHHPEISIELDPRGFSAEWALVLAAAHVTRVSLGVQTFAPHIQQAIGRIQPLSHIERVVAGLRLRDINAINFDLMYGLPGQTLADLDDTLEETIRLAPSRISLFGYAHLPHMIPRQRQIDASNLPDHKLRFEQAWRGYERLTEAGYVPVGFDHFALPSDPLADAAREGRVSRNFQGFTEDDSPVLIGIGASAISRFPDLIVQNEKRAGVYRDLIAAGQLTPVRGVVIDADDRERRRIIRELLCQGNACLEAGWLRSAHTALAAFERLHILRWDDDRLVVEDDGLPYARLIAAQFDRHRGAILRDDLERLPSICAGSTTNGA